MIYLKVDSFLSSKGYYIVKDSDYNLSIEDLSFEIASFIKDCKFLSLDKTLENNYGEINLKQLVEILYKNEKENEFTSKIFEILPMPSVGMPLAVSASK